MKKKNFSKFKNALVTRTVFFFSFFSKKKRLYGAKGFFYLLAEGFVLKGVF